MNWFQKVYGALLKIVDGKLAQQPVNKAINKAVDKTLGPLVK